MAFTKILALYFSVLAIGLVIDVVWLVLMNPRFYKVQLGGLMSGQVNWLAAGLFYALFIIGLIVLVILPAVDRGSWSNAILLGGLLGMVAYSTYDLTNQATLKDWPLIVTIVDIVWGTVLSASLATIGFFIAKALA